MDLGSIARFLPLRAKALLPSAITNVGNYVEMPDGYRPTNPSLVANGDGYFLSTRGVNYEIKDRVSLDHSFRVGSTFHTVNRFAQLDRNLNLVQTLPGLNAATENIEDIRLFSFGDTLMGIGCRPSPGRSRIIVLTFSNDLNEVDVRDLPSPYGLPREKNWCPFVKNDRVYFLYSRAPLVVLRYDPERADPLRIVQGPAQPADGIHLDSGSSAGISLAQGTLFLMHRRRVDLPSFKRTYLTRACILSDDMGTLSCGPYFSIGRSTIQFANGLSIDDDHVLMAYGEMDSAALLARFRREEFLREVLPHHVDLHRSKPLAVAGTLMRSGS